MIVSRRTLGRLALAVTGLLAAGRTRAAAPARVVVLGGGAGGATAARLLARLGGSSVEVTLVDADPVYVSCFFSNWVIAGLRDPDAVTWRRDRLPDLGIRVVTARADAIDRDARQLVLAGGERLAYDRLIAAPGVELAYRAVPGYSEDAAERMPHGWKAGPQTLLLRDRLAALPDGGRIVMTVPDNPYRCPPGPYERASLFAHVLHATGRTRARITILDAKAKFSKQALFQESWERLHPGMVEWLAPDMHGGIESVDPATGTVVTGLGAFRGDLVNVIPPQTAPAILKAAGLAGESGWCPVDPATMAAAGDPSIQVVGDSAAAGEMPKSAFSANAQAKLAAVALLADLFDRPAPEPRLFNTCWSLLSPDEAVKVGALYRVEDGAIVADRPFVSTADETGPQRRAAVGEAEAWYAAITAEMFGGRP